MYNPTFATGSYYHIYNRGVEKREITLDKWDIKRFLETINFYQKTPTPMKLSDYRRSKAGIKKIKEQKDLVKIYCYCLMPNHFHFLLQQMEENGISIFCRKFSDSYTKYFNTRHNRVGSLFQGAFKARLVETDEYLLQLSKYIHRNPFPLKEWEGKVYPYSSYGYYLSGEPHPFCDTQFISEYFSKTNPQLSYQSFVEEIEPDDINLFSLAIDHDD